MTRLVEIPAQRLAADGHRSLFRYEEKCVVLFNLDGALYALDDSCRHASASLFSGKLDGRFIQCQAHGLRFDLASYPVTRCDTTYFVDFSDSRERLK